MPRRRFYAEPRQTPARDPRYFYHGLLARRSQWALCFGCRGITYAQLVTVNRNPYQQIRNMAQRNEKVYDRVRQELQKNPQLGSRELYEAAKVLDKSVSQDTLQQFHARYVLPVRRGQRVGGAVAKKAAPVKRGRRKAQGAAPKAAAADVTPPVVKARRGRRPRAQTPVATPPATGRNAVRALFLQFAQELTDAESRSSLVKVLGRVDSYVDRIVPGEG